jgi:hypothetical protein
MEDDQEDYHLMELRNLYEEALMKGIINEDDNMQEAHDKIALYVIKDKEVRDAE